MSFLAGSLLGFIVGFALAAWSTSECQRRDNRND